nr:MAG TPA: hypothetical protein [Caudoviricetes sp.]
MLFDVCCSQHKRLSAVQWHRVCIGFVLHLTIYIKMVYNL